MTLAGLGYLLVEYFESQGLSSNSRYADRPSHDPSHDIPFKLRLIVRVNSSMKYWERVLQPEVERIMEKLPSACLTDVAWEKNQAMPLVFYLGFKDRRPSWLQTTG